MSEAILVNNVYKKFGKPAQSLWKRLRGNEQKRNDNSLAVSVGERLPEGSRDIAVEVEAKNGIPASVIASLREMGVAHADVAPEGHGVTQRSVDRRPAALRE